MKAKILWVEGKRADSPSFVPDLRRKGFIIEVVPTGSAAQACLSEAGADLVVVNAASLRSSGERICQVIRTGWQRLPILVIANPERSMPKDADMVGQTTLAEVVEENDEGEAQVELNSQLAIEELEAIEGELEPTTEVATLIKPELNRPGSGPKKIRTPKYTCADVVLKLPFTSRKLVNRIVPMLPAVSNNLLQSGPISLDMDRRLVRCNEKEGHLTPRLTLLLKIFMHHPGEVLEREDLFRQVWNTEYTGDTRTLDVHISWLRQAIEVDPRKPRFLRTIRGVGYRLDV